MLKIEILLLLLLNVFVPAVCAGQTKSVRFILDGANPLIPGNSSLFLAGSMNNWHPADSNYRFLKNADGEYELKVTLPEGLNEYKITRGSWSSVETQAAGTPMANRMVRIKKDTVIRLDILQWQDNFKAPAKTHTASKHVHVIDTGFVIPQLNRTRRIWVYLPPDYETSARRFPVIYMQDGQNLFDAYTAGYGEWATDEQMDSLYQKRSAMAIIVGIDHGAEHRLTEYNPFDNERFGKGRGDDYVDFLVHSLKPFIDQKYRTKSSPGNTTIAGSSMGGLISLYAVAKYPKVFGKAGIFSPAFWIAPEIYDFISRRNPGTSKIFFVAGELESTSMVTDMKKMYDQLLAQGSKRKQLHLQIAPDGKHSEWFWHREYPRFYNWIMN